MNNQSILVENVPIDWVIKKIKYVFDERKETNDPIQTDVLVSLTHDRGVILHSEKGDIGNKEKDDIKKYKIVHPGDIVVNSMNVIIGSSGLSDHFGLVSPVYYMLVKKDPNHDNKFFHYLFRSIVFQKSLIGVGNGILEHRMRVPIDKLGGHLIPLPSANEQKLISQYLDKKISQIDSLVEKIQKKIDLLKEQRTSLINHYVTKGLDPNVEMKDSGIEWVGEIPKHWSISKLRYQIDGIKDGTHGTHKNVADGYLLLSGKNIQDGNLVITDSERRISEEDHLLITGNGYPKKGDILFVSIGATLGKTTVYTLDDSLSFQRSVCFIRPKSSWDSFYMGQLLSSETVQGQIKQNVNQSTIGGIYMGDLVEVFIPIPPQKEQKDMTKQLDKELKQIEEMIRLEKDRISLFVEYRQSLISSVVTGKVRISEEMI